MTRLIDVLPNGPAGRALQGFLASSITAAHAANPMCWGLTVRDSLVRLNVGTPEAISFDNHGIRVCVLTTSLPRKVLEWDNVYLIEREGHEGTDVYRSAPGSRLLGTTDLRTRPLKAFLDAVQQSQLQFVRVASMSTPNPMTKKSHTPDCIDELAKLTHRMLAQPRYWTPLSSVRRPAP
jgi:hypothetical protein